MINQLYTFSAGSFVVADEWNSNFDVIDNSNTSCAEAIEDANDAVAFPNSDLSGVYNSINLRQNSFAIAGDTVIISPECEYYKTLTNGSDLTISIPTGFSSEARIILKTQNDRTLVPITVSYSGTSYIRYGLDLVFPAGTYYVLIYVVNGIAQLKMIWTGE